MSLAEAAARGDELAQSGAERELAALRQEWDEEVESATRSGDYRERAVAYRAIGQFRFRQKLELLRRGVEDESPAARGSALLSVQLLSRDSPGVVNRRVRHFAERLFGGGVFHRDRSLCAVPPLAADVKLLGDLFYDLLFLGRSDRAHEVKLPYAHHR